MKSAKDTNFWQFYLFPKWEFGVVCENLSLLPGMIHSALLYATPGIQKTKARGLSGFSPHTTGPSRQENEHGRSIPPGQPPLGKGHRFKQGSQD